MDSDEDAVALGLALGVLRAAAGGRGGVAQEPAADDGMMLAMQVLRSQPMSRRESLARARRVKAKNVKKRQDSRVENKLACYNSTITRKRDQLISVGGKVSTVKLSHSDHKKWTPSAFLKVCFAERLDDASRSRGATRMRCIRGIKRLRSRNRQANPHASSTRAKAGDNKGSGSYVQKMRDSMAHLIMEKQQESVEGAMHVHGEGGMSHAAHAVLEVALDETEQKVAEKTVIKCFLKKEVRKVIHVQQRVAALVLHLFVTLASVGTPPRVLEYFCPMLPLAAKTADCMMQAVRAHTMNVKEALGSSSWTLLLVSDWAKSNRKLFRQMIPAMQARTALHCRCIMHMIALAIAAAAVRLRVVGPVFCGSILLHNSSTQSRMASYIERLVGEPGFLEVMVEPLLSDRERSRIDRLVDLMHWDESMLGGDGLQRTSTCRQHLQEQLDELKKFLQGRNKFAHVCPFRCCKNISQTKERLVSILLQLFVFRVPATPALNRWTQLYPALAYWCVASHLPNKLMARLWGMAFDHCHGSGGHAQLDLLAPAEDEVLSRVNAVRALKVLRWISHPRTPTELLIICMAMRPIMSFMGYLFREESSDSAHSVTSLMKSDSPLPRVVRFLVDQLATLDGDFWLVYMGEPDEAWDTYRLQLALDTFYTMAAGLWFRVGRHLDMFPWRLWHVVDPEATAQHRAHHAELLSRYCPSCVDRHFTQPILEEHGAQEVSRVGSAAHEKVLISLRKSRASNIMSELRFARITKHMMSSKFGRAASSSSMACKHTLAELSAMHARATTRWEQEEAVPKIDAPSWSAKASSGWHSFLKQQRVLGRDMKEIGRLWRGMADDEKSIFKTMASEEAIRCRDQVDLHEPMPSSSSPFGIGDFNMPVREDIVATLCEGNEVYRRAEAWRANVKKVQCPTEGFVCDPPPPAQCGELYGAYKCAHDFTDEVKARCADFLGRLRAVVHALKDEEHLPLLLLEGHRQDPEDDRRHQLLALVAFKLLKDPEAIA